MAADVRDRARSGEYMLNHKMKITISTPPFWTLKRKALTTLAIVAILGLGLLLPAFLGGVAHGANIGKALMQGWKEIGSGFKTAGLDVGKLFTGIS